MKWKKFECAICGQRLIIIKTGRKLNAIDENNQHDQNYITDNVYKRSLVLTIQNLILN